MSALCHNSYIFRSIVMAMLIDTLALFSLPKLPPCQSSVVGAQRLFRGRVIIVDKQEGVYQAAQKSRIDVLDAEQVKDRLLRHRKGEIPIKIAAAAGDEFVDEPFVQLAKLWAKAFHLRLRPARHQCFEIGRASGRERGGQ